MGVLGKLFGKRGAAEPPQTEPEPDTAASTNEHSPEPQHHAPQPYLDVELPPGMLGVGEEPQRTHLPSHEPVERLPVATQPDVPTPLEELQTYRTTPGFKNFMDKTKHPPGTQPRRPSFPDDLHLPRDTKR